METATMKTVTLEVASREDVTRRALEAFKGKKQRARISFATPELLWKVLTAKRWEVLKAMAGQGPLTIREVSRRVGRDVKAVHGDVHALIDAGLLERTETNRVAFPFDAIRVEFTLRAA
jgi:predicted transcriptional regulator